MQKRRTIYRLISTTRPDEENFTALEMEMLCDSVKRQLMSELRRGSSFLWNKDLIT